MFTKAFKSLLRFLKENGFPYKCRLYGNLQFATNCYAVVLYYRMFKYSLCKKISYATFGVSIDDFFTRYAGLGYSLLGMIGNLKTDHVNVFEIQLPCQKVFSSYLGYKNLGYLVL